MNAVAIDASGYLLIPLSQELTVPARVILRHLIRLDRGTEPMHISRIAVTAAAKLWDLLPGRLAAKPFGGTHRHLGIHAGGITSMTGSTGKSLL
jgi:hypothetical protein